MKQLIAYCGLDCETCKTVGMVTINNDKARKKLGI